MVLCCLERCRDGQAESAQSVGQDGARIAGRRCAGYGAADGYRRFARWIPEPARSAPVIERYDVELRNVNRVYALPGSALRQAKLEKFYADQLQLLENMRFDALSQAGKVDYLLLRDRLEREQKQFAEEARQDAEIAAADPVSADHHRPGRGAAAHGDRRSAEVRGGAGEADRVHRGSARASRQRRAPRCWGARPCVWPNCATCCAPGTTSTISTIPSSPGGWRASTRRPMRRSMACAGAA